MGLTPQQEIALKELDEKLEQTGSTMNAAQKAVMVKFGTQPTIKLRPGFKETGPKIEQEDDPKVEIKGYEGQ
tara:strand:- start:2631 stop:2846 length:216 start_codon:yes stop_codon:yes gene_type:complete